MYADFIYPEYEVVRNYQRCIACRACERQCANEVHRYDADEQMMTADDAKCVNCHRCVSLCPTRALKIVRTDHTFKENANWTKDNIQNVYRQAATGGVLLSSMGNPEPLPGYWDRILINASQVTNPPIDPLREPMETRVFLGKKDMEIRRDENGAIVPKKTPHIELAVPIMFSAMSYGSISYNAHESLARAATELGVCYNTGEGGLHEDFYRYGPNTIVQVASGRFGVHSEYLNAGAAVEIKMGQGAKPGIGGPLPRAENEGGGAPPRPGAGPPVALEWFGALRVSRQTWLLLGLCIGDACGGVAVGVTSSAGVGVAASRAKLKRGTFDSRRVKGRNKTLGDRTALLPPQVLKAQVIRVTEHQLVLLVRKRSRKWTASRTHALVGRVLIHD